jgi:hypothetical protein
MTGLRSREACLYVDFFRAPQLILRELGKFGAVDSTSLAFVDATSSQLLVDSALPHAIRNLDSLAEISRVICQAIREVRPARVVIDSMEFLADRFPRDELLREWQAIAATAREVGAAVAFLFINWTYGDADVELVLALCDHVIEFQTRIRTGVTRNFLRITPQGAGKQTAWIPYTFRDVSGLKVYFPRILVTGPPDAGKSTVVRALCGNSVSVDKMGTTVAFDYGNLDMGDLEAEVVGTPGQERFEFLFSIFAREVSGVLMVVDRTRREDLERARQILKLAGKETPVVVLANKSDLPGGLTEDELRQGLGLAPDTPILATVATAAEGTREAMRLLAERVMGV